MIRGNELKYETYDACKNEKKKRKRDYGRILAILVVVVFAFCWIMDDYYNVDVLWDPYDGWEEDMLVVERQGKEDKVHCAWAMWEEGVWIPDGETVRFFFLGKQVQEILDLRYDEWKLYFDGVEVKDSLVCIPQDVMFVPGAIVMVKIEKERPGTITMQLKNDLFTVNLKSLES